MEALITSTVFGILLSVLGIVNMNGNISSLHWYHRHRVTQEDRRPFGRLVGLGTLLTGTGLIVFGVLYYIFEQTQLELYLIIGAVALLAGIVTGLVLSFYAMVKYNKGIF